MTTRDVVWLTNETIEFLLRHGDDKLAHYQRLLDHDNSKRMAAAGVTHGRIFFYKGSA